ncbi:hypothetical protein [Bacillus cereus group sp. IBL03679]|uniref:hypothetical protein n=1 Tax=Bacillus cereus group sp. IBL03679 TaxID=3240095 RepID=UPI003D2F6B17
MKKNTWKNLKVFVIYFIIIIIYNTLFDYTKKYVELKMNNNLLSQVHLAIGRTLLSLLILFLPDKLGIKIHFISKIFIYIIAMITVFFLLDMFDLLD